MKINYHLKSPSGCGDEHRQDSKGKGLFNAVACALIGYWEKDVLKEQEWLEATNYTDEMGACIDTVRISIGNANYECTVTRETDSRSLYFRDLIVFNAVVVNRTAGSKWHLKAMKRATCIIPQHCRVAFKAWECLT